MKIINYCFYRIYHVFSKGEDSHDGAILSTLIFTILAYINILAAGTFLKKFGVISTFIASKTVGISLEIMLFIIGWLLFVIKKKYISIENQFKNESKRERTWGNFAVFLSFILSFAFILLAGFYRP